jgi:large subunit ribosomal protein L20
MTRIKGGTVTRQHHKEILKEASGFDQGRRRLYRRANEAVLKARAYAYRDRRNRKRDFRRLWIQRINAAARQNGITYNRFIQGLGLAGVQVDRRMLAELAVNEPKTFASLVATAKNALPADVNAPKA